MTTHYQDGADFYLEGVGDQETGGFVESAPFVVCDMQTAFLAREWFKARHPYAIFEEI